MRQHRLGVISRLQQKCDKEFSKMIRAKEVCEKCGQRGLDYDTAHIISRKNLTLRWDIFNVLCLCRPCHMRAHANPNEFTNWFKAKYAVRYDYVQSMKNRILKRTSDDYAKLLDDIGSRRFEGLILQVLD